MDKGLLMSIVAIAALIIGLCIGLGVAPTKEVVKEVPVDKLVVVEGNSKLQDEAANKILKDDKYEVVAYNLAVAELEKKEYKELFNWMKDNNVSIEEKADISKVVIKDSEVSDINADDEEATVELELRVYYENTEGDNKKVYINAEYDIVDGEVEEVEFSFA